MLWENSNIIQVKKEKKKRVTTCDRRHRADCSQSTLTFSHPLTRHPVMHNTENESVHMLHASPQRKKPSKTPTFNRKAEEGGDLKEADFSVS